jgi:pyruvate/2-oxoglutarate dehydrogenase complex dihydrolipoamide dehydrogenase (E3) component
VTNTSAPEEIDVLVIGSGAGGGVAALEIARSGRTVVLVEMGRVGGECHYVSCVPSKALLIAAREGVTWDEALRRRDEAADGRSDSAAVREHEKAGVQIVRGTARVTGDHDVAITFDEEGERVFRWAKALVLAPGSEPVIPRVPGLALEMTWTSEQALSSDELPSDLLVMGGGAVGCEMAQIYAAFGTQVTLVEKTDRLLAGEQPWVGELVAANLRASGVNVRAGVEATQVEHRENVRVEFSDNSRWSGDRVLLAGGRTPRTAGLGLELLGISLGDKNEIPVDARCHVMIENSPAEGVYAVGDVTATAPFTHTANAQARTVAGDLDGAGRDVQLHASPRVVYTEATVWCVGLTEQKAREARLQPRSASIDLSQVERGTLEGFKGRFELIADEHGTAIGAAAVGSGADSWATSAQLAVQFGLHVERLGDTLFAFPTLAEAVGLAARELAASG